MVYTKQTARKAVGEKVPRKQPSRKAVRKSPPCGGSTFTEEGMGVRPSSIFKKEGGAMSANIAGALQEATTARMGTFAVGTTASALPPLPGLKIDDELVALPVLDPEKIISKATPFGPAWQLESKRVTFENPQWHTGCSR